VGLAATRKTCLHATRPVSASQLFLCGASTVTGSVLPNWGPQATYVSALQDRAGWTGRKAAIHTAEAECAQCRRTGMPATEPNGSDHL